MTIYEAVRLGTQALATVPDPRIDAEWLLCEVTGLQRMALHLSAAQALSAEQEQRYRELLALRAGRTPLQYILGTQQFYGIELRVDETVLIPRQETETLCELALKRLNSLQSPRVADLCTGSGALAIAIRKHRPDAAVWATELSPAALATAEGNAARNGAEITVLQGDLLAPLAGLTFDLIVSNPPYIPSETIDILQPEVLREPRMALDGGTDGLNFYRRLAQEAPACLRPGGRILLEFGDGQAEAIAAVFAASRQFEDIQVHADLYGKPRVFEARAAGPGGTDPG